jgi:SAM-dependent methyltransferase
MDPLTQIGLKHSTDKAVDHKFTPFYHSKLESLRDKNINVLEIGVFHAQSLRTWKDYFYNAKIYGFDIDDRRCYQEDRIIIEQGDQTDIPFLKNVFNGVEFDLIIDDGGHTMFQQQTTLVHIFDRLKPGGVYILEDLHTSLLYPDKERTTLKLLSDISENKSTFDTFEVSGEDILRVKNEIDVCEIFKTNNGHSITSYITKKK